MKIVVLQSHPFNPGDFSWEPLEALGEVIVYESTSLGQVAERIQGADIVCTQTVKIDAAAIEKAQNLKLINIFFTGTNAVDLAAAKARGVTVCNVPGYSTDSVAQLAIGMMIELTHRIGELSAQAHTGEWTQKGIFTYWNQPIIELAGKQLTIVGMGAIGKRVASIATALGMKVVVADLPHRPSSGTVYPRLPWEEAIGSADVVSLHCPLTAETQALMNAENLALLKSTAFVVNTARGGLMDESALAAALQSHRLAGYAGDGLSVEPPPTNHPLLGVPNCILTPHIGWASVEARARLMAEGIRNIQAFLKGEPRNMVG